MENVNVVWAPQPGPQEALVHCPYPLVGFGGARGGGKTDGVLGKWGIKSERYGSKFNAVFFRKELPQTDDLIERAKEIYLPTGAEWHEQKKMFVMRRGGRVRFRPLENDIDAEKYQGQNLTDAAVEEAGNYENQGPIFKLFGALRSTTGVPIQLILTFNPGGRGHKWIKDLFVVPCRSGFKRLEWKLKTGKVVPYVFIPSRVTDNQILLHNDPEYVDRLYLSGPEELVRAWVDGDFDIHMGAFFDKFGGRHIVSPHPIPQHWTKYLGFDWGYNSPFCALWAGVSSGRDDNGREVPYPKGSLVVYREYSDKKIENKDIAKRILEIGKDYEIAVCDPSIFAHDGGPSIADQFRGEGLAFRPGDNERISGWNQIRQRLNPDIPYLYIFESCRYLIDTLPALPMDPKHPEDADTAADDHACDALRYICKERLLENQYKVKVEAVQHGNVRIKQYVERVRRERESPTI